MKTDDQGTSTCAIGQESYEIFMVRGKKYIQYDYRRSDGELFSCVAQSLAACRSMRDQWLLRGGVR